MGLSCVVTRSILPSRHRRDAHSNTQYTRSHLACFLVDGGWSIVSGITPCAREATERQGWAEKEKASGSSRRFLKSAFFRFISSG